MLEFNFRLDPQKVSQFGLHKVNLQFLQFCTPFNKFTSMQKKSCVKIKNNHYSNISIKMLDTTFIHQIQHVDAYTKNTQCFVRDSLTLLNIAQHRTFPEV